MINDKADEVIKELFNSLTNRYQNNLESMKGCEFVFNNNNLLHYKYHKINPNRVESYIDSPDWIKNKKATINSVHKKNNKSFQYALTIVLNHVEFCILKKKKYILLMFQNITQIVKNKLFF